MHNNAVAGNRLEYDEVAHVPVEDRRSTQLVQMLELVSERPAKQMQLARQLNQSTKRNPVQRYGMPSSQRVLAESTVAPGGNAPAREQGDGAALVSASHPTVLVP